MQGAAGAETGRVEQADADPAAPELVFETGVDRRAEHLRAASGADAFELQYVEVEIGLRRAVVGDRRAREFEAFGRDARDGVLLAPAHEAQIGDGQRGLQVGQDVVGGSQIDGEAVAGRFGRLHVEVADLEVRLLGGDVGAARGEVDRTPCVDVPAILFERDVEAVVVQPGAGGAGEELAPHAYVEPFAEQRERVGEGGLEVGARRDADVRDASAASRFEELEERVGQVGVFRGAHVEFERPEMLAVARICSEAEDVDARVDVQSVFRPQSGEGVGARDRGVEQRHQLPVAGKEQVAQREVAADGEVDTAQHGNVEVAAMGREGGVELHAEGRALHEIGRGVLRRDARRHERDRQQEEYLFHVR